MRFLGCAPDLQVAQIPCRVVLRLYRLFETEHIVFKRWLGHVSGLILYVDSAWSWERTDQRSCRWHGKGSLSISNSHDVDVEVSDGPILSVSYVR